MSRKKANTSRAGRFIETDDSKYIFRTLSMTRWGILRKKTWGDDFANPGISPPLHVKLIRHRIDQLALRIVDVNPDCQRAIEFVCCAR